MPLRIVFAFAGVGIIIFFGGTTFFASVSKFTKEVGQTIKTHYREKTFRRVERATSELFQYRRGVHREDSKLKTLRLSRRVVRTPALKKFYEDDVSAAQVKVDCQKIECKKRWDFLARHRSLPINPLTRKRWTSFDDFLEDVKSIEVEKRYA